MNLGNLLHFLKDFSLTNENLTRESVSLMFTKRCPNKSIDFPGFIDILFKMSLATQTPAATKNERNTQFQAYLDHYILSQHSDVLERQLSPRLPKVIAFGREYGLENEALRTLEGHDDLLKHVIF